MSGKRNKLFGTRTGSSEPQLHTPGRPGNESDITVGNNITSYSLSSKGQFSECHLLDRLDNPDVASLGREPFWFLETHYEEFSVAVHEHRFLCCCYCCCCSCCSCFVLFCYLFAYLLFFLLLLPLKSLQSNVRFVIRLFVQFKLWRWVYLIGGILSS